MISLLDILKRIDDGSLTPAGAIAQALEAVTLAEPAIGAFTHIDAAAAAPVSAGPLRGVAIGVKDIIDVAGMPTRMGSPIYDDSTARADAAIVALARRSGATILGKTTTTPFAFLDPTSTRNPHDHSYSPGGSSAGSAAAVGAGMVPLAIGTQTGGSVIRPASYCGVAAVKPSFRILPTVGVKCYSWSLDTPGLFAATIADVAYALAALSQRAELRLPGDEGQESGADLRIGVLTQGFAGPPEDDAAAAVDAAIKAIEARGARVIPVIEAPELAVAFDAHGTVQDFEVAQALAWEYDNHRDALPPILRQALDEAQHIPVEEYDAARRAASRARKAWAQMAEHFDAALTFSSPGAAPASLSTTGNSRFNRLWTLVGAPCVNIPGFLNAAGMPVGVQIVARFGRDDKALRAAAFVEKALRAPL
ncbi:MAG: amidase [Salinarimonadaceae bacterium]|nr:MAG: amidase [Salinarimonadaceae bacterium]